jgi:hypothetical protein
VALSWSGRWPRTQAVHEAEEGSVPSGRGQREAGRGAARRLPRPRGVPPADGSARQLRVCDEVCKALLAVQIFRTRPARCRRRGWAGGHQARATPSHNLMMDAVVFPLLIVVF